MIMLIMEAICMQGYIVRKFCIHLFIHLCIHSLIQSCYAPAGLCLRTSVRQEPADKEILFKRIARGQTMRQNELLPSQRARTLR
jgi:hypothetical protein